MYNDYDYLCQTDVLTILQITVIISRIQAFVSLPLPHYHIDT